jgi:ABC-2 type transport system ATP-binding protein
VEIEFNNVTKIYNPGLFKKRVRAVTDLSLSIPRGEVFGLIGPNGAGKSTSIRLLLGLMRPTSGVVRLRGKVLSRAERNEEIGYLPENPYLYDHLSLRELLVFCGRASGMGARERNLTIDELLEKVTMTSSQNRPLRTFSKGMLQRAGICFALLHDPAVVILDEPMSGLDPVGRKLVFDIVMDLKQQGKTIFFCSHILSDVERLCDRIGVLLEGQLVKLFNQNEFREETERPIHLKVGRLTTDQSQRLEALGGEVLPGHDRDILSVGAKELPLIIQHLDQTGIPVVASRSERFSLEEMFLQVVEESSK